MDDAASCSSVSLPPILPQPVTFKASGVEAIPALHPHPLFLSDAFKVYSYTKGWWRCDACGTKMHRNELLFHCFECDYDVCASCYYQVVGHHRHLGHTLVPDYRARGRGCDCHAEDCALMFQCRQCPMRFCDRCFQSVQSVAHAHPLYVASPGAVYPGRFWRCDRCSAVFGGDRRSLLFHCRLCDVDLCFECLMAAECT